MTSLSDQIIGGLRKYFSAQNKRRGVLGVSGGVDSALTLKLSVDALGAENVIALIMPELGVTKQENIDHAKALCSFFGVRFYYIPINPFLQEYTFLPWKPNKHALMNTKARIRAVLLYNFANTEDTLVLGTSNKSEILLGYGTKFGDLAADVEVIGSLSKTEVYRVADDVGIPLEIIEKTPSAELAHGQTDENELGARYAELDEVLKHLTLGEHQCIERGLPAPLVQSVFRRVRENRHKTEMPFVIAAEKEIHSSPEI